MSKNQYLSSYQKGIVNRFYAGQDSRVANRLAELVSDLYVTTSEAAAKKKWETVGKELAKSNAEPGAIAKILTSRDLKALAELIGKPGFSAERPKAAKVKTDIDDV
jgi:hypothetical protein